MSILFTVFLIIGGFLLYFLPTIVANQKKHRNKDAILLVNALLGWSLLGWVVALIWAIYKKEGEN